MQSRNNVVLIIIILLIALATYIALPIDHPDWFTRIVAPHQKDDPNALSLRLGLDLQGGTQIQLMPDLPEGQTATEEDLDRARAIIERRVNGLGVNESLVQTGKDRIIVALPGVEDPDAAIETLRGTGQLEFVDLGDTPLPAGAQINTTTGPAPNPVSDTVFETIMTGDKLKNVDVRRDPNTQQLYIAFELTKEGSEIFGKYSGENIGKYLAIVMDKTILSAPVIRARITDAGIIEGDFTVEEAQNLAIQMKYGALPVPLKVVDVRTVGPSLGEDSVRRSLLAGTIGVIVVLLFMLAYYRLPGFIADLALLSFVAFNIALYKVIPVVLTLPGIAGFLLTTGTAVDANILIFERLREELRAGRSLPSAVEAGFSRAWTSILDSNLSTILTGLILLYFGSNFGASVVQGFAVTLIIGVLISMFTAVFATRTFMRFMIQYFAEPL
ncbi:MAG TPA: protein translocase subunit SecD, partial [Caldilineae bacterium]|nr:protein translocase subunit SecD [Caldilineae bacterium]